MPTTTQEKDSCKSPEKDKEEKSPENSSTIRDKKIREILKGRNEMKNAQQIVQSRQEYH